MKCLSGRESGAKGTAGGAGWSSEGVFTADACSCIPVHRSFERLQVCFFNILRAHARKCTLRSFKRIKLPPDVGRTSHNPLTLQSSTLGWQIRMTSFGAYGRDLKHPLPHIALSVRQPCLPQSANPALLTTVSWDKYHRVFTEAIWSYSQLCRVFVVESVGWFDPLLMQLSALWLLGCEKKKVNVSKLSKIFLKDIKYIKILCLI